MWQWFETNIMNAAWLDGDGWITLITIVILLIFSGLLSGSETALTATSKARMLRLEQEGSVRARWVIALLERKEHLISAILLCNNLVNILASVLATSFFLRVIGENGIVYATVIMTITVVVFAEVLPKTYAILTPDMTALRMSWILRIIVWVLSPITHLLQVISRFVLRLAGFTEESAGNLFPAHEEIRGAIDLHHREGAVVKNDRDMLGGILDLATIQVNEVTVHRKNMLMIDFDQPSADIIRQALESPFTRIPLWQTEQENIIGVIHAKDISRALAAGPADQVDIATIMTPPWFVPETTSLSEQLAAFRRRKAHFAIVVDEYGSLTGLITMEDILEEIVGHIHDEHDEDEQGVKRASDGAVEVDGTMSIRDLNRDMGWNLPDEEATTIAGLVIHAARIIPDVGQVFDFYGYRFHVMRRQRNQILAIKIEPHSPSD
jgi:Mg2+/Co2+ transporter CorB